MMDPDDCLKVVFMCFVVAYCGLWWFVVCFVVLSSVLWWFVVFSVTPQEMGSGKGTESGNARLLFPDISSAEKERKVTANYRSFSTK